MELSILSLDGGGIRGIITASILAHIEARVQELSRNNQLKIADCFDLLSGTSTGGIIVALALTPSDKNEMTANGITSKEEISAISRPKYSAADILELYLEMGPLLFQRSLWYRLGSGFGLFKSRYNKEAVEEHCKKCFGDRWISEVVKDCLITSYEMNTRKALFFSKYNVLKYGDSANYKLSDIARATSAAPTYFSPALINAKDKTFRHLVDGGVYANNPAMCALVETVKLWPGNGVKDYFMLSVGTGKVIKSYDWEKTHKYGFIKWLEPIIDILTSSVSETVDFQMQQLFSCNGVPDSYIRLEPPLLSSDSRMDNASKRNVKALSEAAKSFIDKNSEVLEKISQRIILPSRPLRDLQRLNIPAGTPSPLRLRE